MDLGIIGKARSGKSSLFNALTRGAAQVGAFTAADKPNVGTVEVPDPRVDALAAVFKPKKTTYAKVRCVDYPVSELGPEGPGARFLADLAGRDALVHVVRAFADDRVPHPDGSVDPVRDFEAVQLELTFADLALIERRLERLAKELRTARAADRGPLERDRDLVAALRAPLEAGGALRDVMLSDEDAKELRKYQFVTRRPMLVVLNLGEDALAEAAAIEREWTGRVSSPGVSVVAACAKLEAELAQMEPGEAQAFRSDLGLLEASPRDRVIQEAYKLLGLVSFLTAGEDECRAWPLRHGATAPEAAGSIHSDLQKGFIRAEVADWRELVDAGSLPELKRRGRLRTEGKAYVVADGDVLNVLFNV